MVKFKPGLMPQMRFTPECHIVPVIVSACSLQLPFSGVSNSVSTKSTLTYIIKIKIELKLFFQLTFF